MTDQTRHWTKDSPKSLQTSLALDFVDQLTLPFEETGWNQSQLAEKLGLSKGRVSQMFNNPGNLTLKKMAEWTQPLDLNVSIVVYPEDEALAARGPISGEVFRICWERLGKPADMWDLEDRQDEIEARFKTILEVSLSDMPILNEIFSSGMNLSSEWVRYPEKDQEPEESGFDLAA